MSDQIVIRAKEGHESGFIEENAKPVKEKQLGSFRNSEGSTFDYIFPIV